MATSACKALRSIRSGCKRILSQAGVERMRRKNFQQQLWHRLTDVAPLEASLREMLASFHAQRETGLALRDRETASLLVRACCVPHAPWEKRELPTALSIMMQALPSRASAADDGGRRSGTGAPEAPDELSYLCSVSGCGEIARYGDAATGIARACRAHSEAHEVRVDLDSEAVLALADSAIASASPGHLQWAAVLHGYLAAVAEPTGYQELEEEEQQQEKKELPSSAVATDGSTRVGVWRQSQQGVPYLDELNLKRQTRSGLSNLFSACARRGELPPAVPGLFPLVLESRQTRLLNAYIHACGRSGFVDDAFIAVELGRGAGIAIDEYTVSSLCSAAGSVRDLARALEVVDHGRSLGLAVDTNVRIVSSILKACAVKGDTRTAREVYARALAADATQQARRAGSETARRVAKAQSAAAAEMLARARSYERRRRRATPTPTRPSRSL